LGYISGENMNKSKLLSFLTTIFASFVVLTTSVFAADTLSLQVNQPKSPTNQRAFYLSFVSLDISGRTISVECAKKGPGEGGFTPVGPAVSLPAGGGSGSCYIPENQVNTAGNYEYRVTAAAGGDSKSAVVVLTYSNNNPSAPSDYRKEELNDCDYRISFRTGDGTDRIEVYRSDSTSFSADSGTRVAGLNIGSNQNGQITNSVPNCQKTYYFAIRAFNSAGNASDIVGDREIYTVIVNPTTVIQHGPIPVTTGTVKPQVLGEETDTGTISGETLGPTPEVAGTADASGSLSLTGILKSPVTWLVALGLAVLLVLFRRRNQQDN
jgi:hypothetical protein